MSDKVKELKTAYEEGKMLQYQKENGEWVDFSKNTVCDDFKFQEHLNYRIKPKCKWTPPNGQEIECKPSLICGDCEYNTFKPTAIKYDGPEFEAPQKAVIGVTTLEKYIKAGIKLIPTKPNQEENFYQLKKDGELIKIDSLQGLKYWIDHGIERFIFIPKEAGLLCFDLDRNHGDGVDGVNNFYSWLKDNGLEQIPLFKNLDGGSFPTYTTTASGGLHLYFKCTGEFKTFATIAPGVEIKYNGRSITAGGSVKNGKAYSLYGELNKAPIIPAPLLLKLSTVLSKEPPKPTARPYGNKYQAKGKRGYTSDQLLDFARQDGVYIRNYEYNKIQNYIEAIRLIAEKVGTAESDCIEQLARDVGNYLYDLVKGDKDNG